MVTRHFADVTAFGVADARVSHSLPQEAPTRAGARVAKARGAAYVGGMLKGPLCLGLCLLTACGGKAGSTQFTQPGSGGAASAGSTHGDAGSSVAGGGDTAGSAASGGRSGTAGSAASGGTAGALIGQAGGTGGKVPDPTAGTGGEGPLACSAPYQGPDRSPRSDGPPDANCANISDAIIISRSRDRSGRVPQGYYYEASDNIAFWNEPCSKSLDETVSRGPTDGMGTFLASYSNDWFYEAAYCFNGVRRLERNLRCDYFDGTTLAEPSDERMTFLAGLLWWSQNQNLSGAAIIGHSVAIGDAVDTVVLCTVSTSHGDFGLCDELRVERTDYRVWLDGRVAIGEPQLVRTIQGQCH